MFCPSVSLLLKTQLLGLVFKFQRADSHWLDRNTNMDTYMVFVLGNSSLQAHWKTAKHCRSGLKFAKAIFELKSQLFYLCKH